MKSPALKELVFQVARFRERERDLEWSVDAAQASGPRARRQYWRSACQCRADIGDRGAMIAECLAMWLSEADS